MKRWLLLEMVSFIKQICMPSDYLTITGMGYVLGENKFTLEYNCYAHDQHNTTQVCYNPSM